MDDERTGELDDAIATVRQWIDAAQRIVVLTGAGISTESGIPDFRGPDGVWTKNPEAEKQATIEAVFQSCVHTQTFPAQRIKITALPIQR